MRTQTNHPATATCQCKHCTFARNLAYCAALPFSLPTATPMQCSATAMGTTRNLRAGK